MCDESDLGKCLRQFLACKVGIFNVEVMGEIIRRAVWERVKRELGRWGKDKKGRGGRV